MLKEKTDLELIEIYSVSLDQNCLTVLFLRHADIAFRTALRITKNTADAEDIVQISFVELIKTIQKFRQEGSFLSWFLKIVSHRSLDYLRSNKRRSLREQQAMKNDYYEEKKLETDDKQKEIIEGHLNQLPSRYREPIYMKIIEGLSTNEVSKILSKPEKTIRTQIARGLEQLKSSLKNSGVTLSVLILTNYLSNLELQAAPSSLKSAEVTNRLITKINEKKYQTLTNNSTFLKPFLALASIIAIAFTLYLFNYQENEKTSIKPDSIPTETILTKKSFFENFDKEQSSPFFEIKNGRVVTEKNGGINKTDCLLINPYTILSIDISQYRLPIKVTYYTDIPLPKPNTTSSPTFEFCLPQNEHEYIYLLFNFSQSVISEYVKDRRASESRNKWFKREIYVYNDRTEAWVDNKLTHVAFTKASDTLIATFTGKSYIDNFLIEELEPSESLLTETEYKTLLGLSLEAKQKNIPEGVHLIKNDQIKKLFNRNISINIFNYNFFYDTCKNFAIKTSNE